MNCRDIDFMRQLAAAAAAATAEAAAAASTAAPELSYDLQLDLQKSTAQHAQLRIDNDIGHHILYSFFFCLFCRFVVVIVVDVWCATT